jgi:hypothetical protein
LILTEFSFVTGKKATYSRFKSHRSNFVANCCQSRQRHANPFDQIDNGKIWSNSGKTIFSSSE